MEIFVLRVFLYPLTAGLTDYTGQKWAKMDMNNQSIPSLLLTPWVLVGKQRCLGVINELEHDIIFELMEPLTWGVSRVEFGKGSLRIQETKAVNSATKKSRPSEWSNDVMQLETRSAEEEVL